MKVMLADIETDALQAAVKSLQEISPDIRGTICDVADAESVERAAQAAFDAFGRVHVVCNNAASRPAAASTTSRWIIGDGSSTST
jgi:NAD(P)-dependent dehydrogenase (short-subunit alcohol dehydrogenase family)